MLSALDTRKLDGPQFAILVFVMASDAGDLVECAFDRQIDHALDEAKIVAIGGRGAGEIARFLHHGALGADEACKLFLEPAADIDGVDLHMAEGIALDGFAGGFALGNNRIKA